MLALVLVTTKARDKTVTVPNKTDRLFAEAYSPYISAPYSLEIIVIRKKLTISRMICINEI